MLVKLLIKAPNQQYDDERVEARLSWTVRHLKEHLTAVYPSAPPARDQRLIFSGHLLRDDQLLSDVFHPSDGERLEFTVHLVVASKAVSGASVPTTGGSVPSSAQTGNPASQGHQQPINYVNAHPTLGPFFNQAFLPMMGGFAPPTQPPQPSPPTTTASSQSNSNASAQPQNPNHNPYTPLVGQADQLAAMQQMYAQYMNQYLAQLMNPAAMATAMAATMAAAGGNIGGVPVMIPGNIPIAAVPMGVQPAGVAGLAGFDHAGDGFVGGGVMGLEDIPLPGLVGGGGVGMAPLAAAAGQVPPRIPVNQAVPPQPFVPPQQPQQAAAPQQQPQQVLNAGPGGAALPPEEAARPGDPDRRDWLDHIYYAFRLGILLLLVVYYSSVTRLCLVLILAITIFIYQTQRRALARHLILRRAVAAAQRQQQQQENLQPNQANDDNQDEELEPVDDDDEEAERQELIRMMDDHQPLAEGLRHRQRHLLQQNRRQLSGTIQDRSSGAGGVNPDQNNNEPSALRTAWIFLSSFFLSLIPEMPEPVVGN